MLITCVTVITDKFVEVDGALILSPSLHQCSILREFKGRQNYTLGEKLKQGWNVTGNQPRELPH